MATRGIFTNQNGTWVQVEQPQVNQSGTWTPVQQGFVNVNGTWQQFFPSSGTQTFSQAGMYTFTVPGGIYTITVDAAGAGGGGGGGMEVGNGDGGGGGGSGGYVQGQVFDVVPGETITILVGAGGTGAPFVGRTTAAPAGNPGGDTVIVGKLGSIICTGGGAGLGGNEAEGGQSGGGGSIICTKLYQLGYLTEEVYRADEQFGQLVRQTDPDVYVGYISWAGTIVRWMGDTSPAWLRWLTTTLTVIIARNWAQHMAYKMGAVEKDSLFGRFLMAVGVPFNRMLGKSKRTGINQCNTL